MRIFELMNSIQVSLTNEESDLLKRFEEATDNTLAKSKMSSREQLIAQGLLQKNVLRRQNVDGKIIFSVRQRKE